MKVDALILAGGRNQGPLQEYTSEEHEALIEIGNKPMVAYVLEAVRGAARTEKIVLVGPKAELEAGLNQQLDFIVDSRGSMLENIQKGVDRLNTRKYVLVITSDIPLIKSEVIDEFVNSCKGKEADIFYPIISRKHNRDKFPQVKRTYVSLEEGTFTGGNMVLIRPEVLNDALEWFEKAIRWRKKPWKLSQLLGFKFIFKFITGRLSLSEIEERVSEITGYKGVGMITRHPEVGFDVDKPSDLQLMREKYIL